MVRVRVRVRVSAETDRRFALGARAGLAYLASEDEADTRQR
jgi:hypothetical protein